MTRECVTVLSAPPTDFAGLDEDHRRKQVVATVRQAIGRASASRRGASVGFARAFRVKLRRLAETAKDRWNLAPPRVAAPSGGETLTAADVLDIRQGVTPGGCLDVFLMSQERAKELGLEEELAASGDQEPRNRPLVDLLGGPRVALSLSRLRAARPRRLSL